MNYTQRQIELQTQFRLGIDTHLTDSTVDIRFCKFESSAINLLNEGNLIIPEDKRIGENQAFIYPVFTQRYSKKQNKAILLLHGLNERNWSKYLTWAEYLCKETGKAVILFPIAFHMNRSPVNWSDPRALQNIMNQRRMHNGDDRSLSFANVALSERISEKPSRFYSSGRQSINDLAQLFNNIKQGVHPFFQDNTQIDIFSYSIGSFLSQITIMTNPEGLFTDSKLFMFCGGSIFSSMFGESRSIMDKTAFARLLQYYMNDFTEDVKPNSVSDKIYESFFSMISPERNKGKRQQFFKDLGNKIEGISLVKDAVIPYHGVVEALGAENVKSRINLLDFAFKYSHENPFPVGNQSESSLVDNSFNMVFAQASQFLA
ncbi:MAG: DUF6051 family protein [Paludibacter sp.]|nr:DUF6051 family protein [Paludibacter sp.]